MPLGALSGGALGDGVRAAARRSGSARSARFFTFLPILFSPVPSSREMPSRSRSRCRPRPRQREGSWPRAPEPAPAARSSSSRPHPPSAGAAPRSGPLTVEAFAIVLYNVTAISYVQSVVPDRILGRMTALAVRVSPSGLRRCRCLSCRRSRRGCGSSTAPSPPRRCSGGAGAHRDAEDVRPAAARRSKGGRSPAHGGGASTSSSRRRTASSCCGST